MTWVKTYSGGKPNYTEPCERCGEVNPAYIHTCTPMQPEPVATLYGSLPVYDVPTEQEPVAWADKYDIEREGHDFYVNRQQPSKDGAPLYTAPPHFIDPSKVARLLDEAFERGKKEAVSEQAEKQEPVAWIEHEWSGTGLQKLHFERPKPTVRDDVVNPIWIPLYTAPPQREWVGLTDEEIGELWGEPVDFMYSGHYDSIRAIEAKLKEKNA